jgi:protein-S-isoprenylcysteine O-methyltransferase Ste14
MFLTFPNGRVVTAALTGRRGLGRSCQLTQPAEGVPRAPGQDPRVRQALADLPSFLGSKTDRAAGSGRQDDQAGTGVGGEADDLGRRNVRGQMVNMPVILPQAHGGASAQRGRGRRYRELLDRAPGSRNWYALRVVYLPQLLILWVACPPLPAGMTQQSAPSVVIAIGCVAWLSGFAFETVGDWQLSRFRANSANREQIMDRGLWRYTRHPNYFGDACIWWGIFLISYGSPLQMLTLVSPLLMTFILTRGTGQRMTERRMSGNRPGYAGYIRRTSGFIPLPPRRPHRRSVP